MYIKNLKNKIFIASVLMAGLLNGGCTMITEELDPCPKELRVRFKYDYNLKWADAFRHEVKSVNIWAFNENGGLVWSDNASGDALDKEDFYLVAPLDEGTYDFVTWCGLLDNNGFDLATYTPSTKEELMVKMNTIEQDGVLTSKQWLPGLYHADMLHEEFIVDPYNPTIKTVTASLMKDTNDIRVMLQNLDGTEMDPNDFTVTITAANEEYEWNNSLVPSPVVTYRPWNVRYGTITPAEEAMAELGDTAAPTDVSTISTLVYELATGRLMVDGNIILTIHRNSDNKDIIRIPLVDYLLLVKGHYGNIGNQEYLDRQDDYSIVFFLDPDNNWYLAWGVYINGWAVVPPQDADF